MCWKQTDCPNFISVNTDTCDVVMDDLPVKKINNTYLQMTLLGKMKYLNELCHITTDQNDLGVLIGKIDDAITYAREQLTPEDDGLMEQPSKKRKTNVMTKSNDGNIHYKDLPTEKRKHSYSGRYGEKAEMMRKFSKTKIPLEAMLDSGKEGEKAQLNDIKTQKTKPAGKIHLLKNFSCSVQIVYLIYL